jgi:hypothetical protein
MEAVFSFIPNFFRNGENRFPSPARTTLLAWKIEIPPGPCKNPERFCQASVCFGERKKIWAANQIQSGGIGADIILGLQEYPDVL